MINYSNIKITSRYGKQDIYPHPKMSWVDKQTVKPEKKELQMTVAIWKYSQPYQ